MHSKQARSLWAEYIRLEAVANEQNLVRLQIELPADQPIDLGLGLHQANLE